MKANIEEIKRKVLPVLQRYGAKRAALFGSCVKGKVGKNSDILYIDDILESITQIEEYTKNIAKNGFRCLFCVKNLSDF